MSNVKVYDDYQVLGMASFLDHQDLTSKALLLLGHIKPIQNQNWMSLKLTNQKIQNSKEKSEHETDHL